MTVIVCVCDGGGMLFSKRRVSRDKEVVSDVVSISDGVLFATEYSAKLFAESDASVIVADNPLLAAGEGDFAFVEEHGISDFAGKISTLVIYRWNRKYPFDFSLDASPEKMGMTLLESWDFAGNAHEKITREIWKKKV